MAPRVLEPAERVGERLLVGQVDAGGRLVEEEQVGLAGQRPGDQHALLLAAGELGDAVARPVGQADHLERVVDRGAVGARERAQQPAPGQPAGRDHLPHRGGYAGRGAGALRHEADPAPVARSASSGVPKSSSEPAVSGSSPVSARTSVDLPEPLAPISATNSPGATVRSMPRRIGRPPMATAPSVELGPGRLGHVRSSASVRLLEGGEVLAHQREVVLVGGLRRSGPRSGRAPRW